MAILPDFDAARFTPGAPINNPYFPLTQGRVLSYQGAETDPETGEVTTERNDLFTTGATFEVRGVQTTRGPRHGLRGRPDPRGHLRLVRPGRRGQRLVLRRDRGQLRIRRRGQLRRHQRRGRVVLRRSRQRSRAGTSRRSPMLGPAYYLEFAPGSPRTRASLSRPVERRHALRALRRRGQDHRQLRAFRRHRVQVLRPWRGRDHRAGAGGRRHHHVGGRPLPQRRPRRRRHRRRRRPHPEAREPARRRGGHDLAEVRDLAARTSPGPARRSMSA